MTRIYTRRGDEGQSSLVGGGRLSKAETAFEVLGVLDQANAAIGWAAVQTEGEMRTKLQSLQRHLFDIGAVVAGAEMPAVEKTHVQALEAWIDRLDEELLPLKDFILPGGTESSARLHMARTMVRRSERLLVAWAETVELDPTILAWINRLSDLLFVLARAKNNQGEGDILWKDQSPFL